MAINPLTGQFVPDQQVLPFPTAQSGQPILPNRIQTGPTFGAGSAGFQAVDPLTGAPPTGLIGSEGALTAAADNALRVLRSARNVGIGELRQAGQQGVGEIQGGRDVATQFLEQAIGGFDPFAQQGTQAGGIQSALSGALGQEAQRQALLNLQPVNEFLQQQGEQALNRQAAALGGIGGGNVRRELVRFGQGLAGQSAQQQFANLGTVANRGFGSLQEQGALRGRQGDISAQAGRDIGSLLQQTGRDILGARQAAGRDIAGVFGGTGQQLATGRTRAGEQIAGAIGGTTSALADLVSQQGQQAGAVIGGTQSNLANLLSGAGQQQAAGQTQLAAILANLATQQGSTVAGLPSIPGIQETEGILARLGQAASGVGTAIAASDVQLKDNIEKVGVSSGGHSLYTWDWTEEGQALVGTQPSFGVLAQEVAVKQPDAVVIGEHGYMMVDYARIL